MTYVYDDVTCLLVRVVACLTGGFFYVACVSLCVCFISAGAALAVSILARSTNNGPRFFFLFFFFWAKITFWGVAKINADSPTGTRTCGSVAVGSLVFTGQAVFGSLEWG